MSSVTELVSVRLPNKEKVMVELVRSLFFDIYQHLFTWKEGHKDKSYARRSEMLAESVRLLSFNEVFDTLDRSRGDENRVKFLIQEVIGEDDFTRTAETLIRLGLLSKIIAAEAASPEMEIHFNQSGLLSRGFYFFTGFSLHGPGELAALFNYCKEKLGQALFSLEADKKSSLHKSCEGVARILDSFTLSAIRSQFDTSARASLWVTRQREKFFPVLEAVPSTPERSDSEGGFVAPEIVVEDLAVSASAAPGEETMTAREEVSGINSSLYTGVASLRMRRDRAGTMAVRFDDPTENLGLDD
jgi:hypothetical protein